MTGRARPAYVGRAAIAGVGWTEFSRASGRSVTALATECARAAVADAGLALSDVDGMLSYSIGDSVSVGQVARALGIETMRWHQDLSGGGSQAASILADAAMAIAAGLADVIVVFRALNGRSGKRVGRSDVGSADFYRPYGVLGPAQMFAMAAQRYLHDTGQTAEDMGGVAVQMRAHAVANPRALRRTPLSLSGYLASPFVAEPLRVLDCCQETDAGCALVVTSASRAAGLRHPAVAIGAAARASGPGASAMDRAGCLHALFSQYVAPQLWQSSGLRPRHIDVAALYDAYTWVVLKQLEDFGFCEPGAGGAFVRGGGLGRTGSLPANLNGGLLSEGYVHGLNNVCEAVVQLRGEAGDRQVPDASVAMCTGFGGSVGSAVILARTAA
jgi:acetyl-CoA acetyltransferase